MTAAGFTPERPSASRRPRPPPTAPGNPNTITSTDPATVTLTRHRTGALHTVVDAAGLHTFTPVANGRPGTEAITGSGPLAGITLTHSGYAESGVAGSFTATTGSTTLHQTTRTFDPGNGRLATVSSGPLEARHRHLPRSPFVQRVEFRHGGQPALISTRGRDELDRITAVTHFIPGTPSAHPLATTGYAYDALHRRQSATDLDGVAWDYDYNDRGEIDTARRELPDGTPLAGQQFDYDFDHIGNLLAKKSGGDASGDNLRALDAQPNALNQLGDLTVPGTFDIIGQAAGAVTVNCQAPPRPRDDRFRADVTAADGNLADNEKWTSRLPDAGLLRPPTRHEALWRRPRQHPQAGGQRARRHREGILGCFRNYTPPPRRSGPSTPCSSSPGAGPGATAPFAISKLRPAESLAA